MKNTDARVDEYIKNAKPFAQPILTHLRKVIHKANPQVVETIKWGMPSFDYKGLYCSMAAFKEHCVFGFWKTKLINDPHGYLTENSNNGGEAMGNFGRIIDVKKLPPDKILIDFLLQAKKLNDDNIKVPKAVPKEKPPVETPQYFLTELKKNKLAENTYKNFSQSCKREYMQWITGAKTEDTRNKRMQQAIEWMAEGKRRNWKYEKC